MPVTSADASLADVSLDALVMPFTNNRQFKAAPRLLARAEGVHYWTADGRQVLDGLSGLWCVNAGHARAPITEAIRAQAATMDFASPFQGGHPLAFEVANRLVALAPAGFTNAFLCNSGSEAVDSALKLALLWHRLRGEGTRTRFIGRERGYHGVGFGTGIGGIGPNRKAFGALTTFADHLPHTHLPENAFSRGLPPHGAHLADALERLVTLHDASTIAAVVVEPMAGSTGVLLPPVGYLERLRAITEKHGILLVFDEVITGFGRLGDGAFGANVFGVTPDLITFAKGVTNGTVPMGGVLLRRPMADALLAQPPGIEWPHGYTYSGHPLACAAALATLELYRAEALFSRGAALAPTLGALVHGLKGTRHVVDVRHLGLAAAVELEPRLGAPGARGFDVFLRCWERGVLVRQTGDIIALAPPLVSEPAHLEQLVTVLAGALRDVA